MKKMAPKKAPAGKMTAVKATRIRTAAKKMLGRDYVRGDKDSAAGAAT